jgi:hypothetical protein
MADAGKRRWVSWNVCWVIVITVLIVGVIINDNFLRPLFFVPSQYDAKILIHWVLILAWLPIWGICVLLKPSRGSAYLLASLLLFGGAIFFYTAFLDNLEAARPVGCKVSTLANGAQQYLCLVGSDLVEYQALPGSMLMQNIGSR